MLSKSGAGTAITQITTASQHVSITIPAGKGGVLRAVSLQTLSTDETIVDSGGLVSLTNTAADWLPFYLLTPTSGVVTLGGNPKVPAIYECEKELPGNSIVYADYTPYDNQSQALYLTLIWELGAKIVNETFHGYVYPLKAAAVTATARASPGTYAVPGGKGGRLYKLYWMPWPTLTTVVQDGGLCELFNDAYDMSPCQFYPTACQAVGAGGSISKVPDDVPWDAPCPQNSTFTVYYTPTNAESQTLSLIIAWRRPARASVA
jgi:hypothetical protein